MTVAAARLGKRRAMEIDGSVALVTGANRGLGQAYARELVRRGAANVYGGARDPATVTEPGVTPIPLDAGRVPPVPKRAIRGATLMITQSFFSGSSFSSSRRRARVPAT